MKKTIATLFLLLFVSIIYGQDEYHKLVNQGALWHTLTTNRIDSPHEWTTVYTIGDTIEYNDTKYLKITNQEGMSIGAIREDTLTRKVYHYFERELLLYDFSLHVGDTMYYEGILRSCRVDSIKQIEFNGEIRKQWYLSTLPYQHQYDIWIEGIGSVAHVGFGLLNPIHGIPLDRSTTYFGCYKNSDAVYFNRESTNSEVCPCETWLVNVEEYINESKEILIYPSPVKDIVNISFENIPFQSIEIYSSDMKLMKLFHIETVNEVQLNISFLPKGIYFFKLMGKESSAVKKVVKL